MLRRVGHQLGFVRMSPAGWMDAAFSLPIDIPPPSRPCQASPAADAMQAAVVSPAGAWQSGHEPPPGVLSHVGSEAPGPGGPGPHLQRQ